VKGQKMVNTLVSVSGLDQVDMPQYFKRRVETLTEKFEIFKSDRLICGTQVDACVRQIFPGCRKLQTVPLVRVYTVWELRTGDYLFYSFDPYFIGMIYTDQGNNPLNLVIDY
jgi:hypothetical protein